MLNRNPKEDELPTHPSYAISLGLIKPNEPLIKLWNKHGWYLPEQINSTKKEMDVLVNKGEYEKKNIMIESGNAPWYRTKRSVYRSSECSPK